AASPLRARVRRGVARSPAASDVARPIRFSPKSTARMRGIAGGSLAVPPRNPASKAAVRIAWMKNVVLLGAARTPVGSFLGKLSALPASALGAAAIRGALAQAA